MSTKTLPPLTSLKKPLDLSPDTFGELRRSPEIAGDGDAMRARLEEDGYLFLPGYLDREEVIKARRVLTDRLDAEGFLDPNFPPEQAIARTDSNLYFRHNTPLESDALPTLLYSGRMMSLYERLLGGKVRHFDFTWIRNVTPGDGTAPHCDIVYMGRGTTNLYTSWTPLSDIPYEVGGLMVLENSHKNERLKNGYGRKDADEWCTNHRAEPGDGPGMGGNIGRGGSLSNDPVRLRQGLGGRWLTSEYCMGDLLIFSMYLVHASLDNHSREIRISTDTRYQLASEPIDERWIGETPIAHNPKAKRGLIC